MTADRARAYAHVMNVVADLGPAKLHDDEQAIIREAADALLFCTDITEDSDARETLTRLEEAIERLVEADRLLAETAESILDAVEDCGPEPVAA
jgi:hypothetical protein